MAAAAVIVFSLLSVMSSSDSEADDVVYSGTSGEVTWTFDPDRGKLEFSGSGMIPDAYRNCSYKHLTESVKSIVIGDSVTSVGAAAFQDCTGLTSVTIGNSVTSIGYFAFEKCKSLTSVFIPDSVTFIGHGVFKNCESLSTIIVGSGNTSFCIVDGVLYNKNVTTLITCPPDKAGVTLKIPSTVTKLEPYSFSNCGTLKNLNLPDTVTDIGGWAFQYVHPDRITIPRYLDHISPHAFCNHEDIDDHYMDARDDPDFDGIRFIDIWGYLVNYNTRDGLMDLSRFNGFVFEKKTDWVFYGKDTYTVTFTDYDGNFVYTARYIEGDTSVIEPANSSDYGYAYTWPEYTLGKENINVREVRTSVEYTVSFDANGGTGTMDSVKTNVELFSEPENKFGIPEEHMHFDGWSLAPDGEKIDFDNFKLDNVTLYARWAWDQYKITFNVEGSVYEEMSVDYGDIMPAPPMFVKIIPGMYTVTKCEWDGYDDYMFMPACDLEFNAVLTKVFDQYNVKFVSEGNIIKEYTADYSSVITLPENPVKEADSRYTYTFVSWERYTEGMTVPTHDLTFTAQFTNTPVQYKVKFVSEGNIVKEYTADYGSEITLPDNPSKASDSRYTYAFASWGGYAEGMTVPDHDIEFTAQFTNIPIKYIVRFVSEGIVVDEHKADYGSTIVLPATPVKAVDSKYSYTFALWEGYAEGMTVPDHDIEFTAQFTNTPVKYNVKFVSEGIVIDEQNADYGSVITLPDTPVKASDSKYTYAFALWKGYAEGMTVPDHDIEFTAQFTSTPIKYTVRFVAGERVIENDVDYGSTIILPENPVKASDSKYTYTFASWKGYTEGMTVPDHDIEFTAQFTSTPIKYTVKFVSEGIVVGEHNVDYGSIITLPESPSKASDSEYTYTFASWKGYTEGMTVPDSDITFEAQFTAAEIPHEPVTPETPEETTTVLEETNIDDGSLKITISSSESSVVTVVEKPKDGIVSAESSAEVTTVIVPDSIVTEAVSRLTKASDKYGAEEKAVVIESDKNELTLSSAALDSVVDAGASTEFRGEAGTLKFSREATGTLASSGEEITLSVSSTGDSVPMGSHKMRISNGSVFALKASAGESAVSSFAGTVTVTLPYVLSEGKTAGDVSVYHINDSGEFTAFKSSYDASSQTVTFETNHFSYWAVTDSELQPAVGDHTISPAIIAMIAAVICIGAIMIYAKRDESE